jgi:hypothetical protein
MKHEAPTKAPARPGPFFGLGFDMAGVLARASVLTLTAVGRPRVSRPGALPRVLGVRKDLLTHLGMAPRGP